MNKIRHFLEEFGSFAEKHARKKSVSGAGKPRELHFELTYRCNTSCVMCNLRYLAPQGKELSSDDIGRITGSPLLNEIEFIVLSGGEPWLKEDLPAIVRVLRGRYPRTGMLILSNLTDTALALRGIEMIKNEIGLDNVSIGSSIDGIGVAHDAMRGKTGSFAALTESLVKIRQHYPGLYVSLNFTLTPDNVDQMLPVFVWGNDHGYHVSFQVVVQKQETRQFVWKEEQLEKIDRQLDAIIEDIWTADGGGGQLHATLLANEGLLSRLLSLHYISGYLRSPQRYFPVCPCGEAFAMIDPYGNLYFCPVHKTMSAGNAAGGNFAAVWCSPAAEQARDYFNRQQCHCWLTCTNGHMIGSAIKDAKSSFITDKFAREGDGPG
jgi:MoaA/NifB/PqqE/SkfB family radical SAM enzyme